LNTIFGERNYLVEVFEGVAELENIDLGKSAMIGVSIVTAKMGEGGGREICGNGGEEGDLEEIYLYFISKIDEHDIAWFLLSTSAVKTDCRNHINATSLDEVHVLGKFIDLYPAEDCMLQNLELGSHSSH